MMEKIQGESGKAGEKLLSDLLRDLPHVCTACVNGVRVSEVTSDSRVAGAGSLFVALKGNRVDGHSFVRKAVEQGCRAVVVAREHENSFLDLPALVIPVTDTRNAFARLAASLHEYPAEKVTLIGITGTNGKTTTSYIIEALCKAAGWKTGIIGTVSYRYGNIEREAPFTTPEPSSLHRLLRGMVDDGVTHVIMEVSSHALEQGRLEGMLFDVAVFTNLSRDHLDFHGTMENYFAAKKKLFTHYLKKGGTVVIAPTHKRAAGGEEESGENWGERLLSDLQGEENPKHGKIVTCGGSSGEIKIGGVEMDLAGMRGTVIADGIEIPIRSALAGEFNLKNILSAVGALRSFHLSPEAIQKGVADADSIPGRLERVPCRLGVEVFVDYSHTPDALRQALGNLRRLAPGRLVVVFGCGGDRDSGKRPLMGEVAGRMADCVILTSDNPRSEDPGWILAEIESGLARTPVARHRAELFLYQGWRGFYDVIESRREAIRTVVRHSRPGDVVLIAGKGHERYQIKGDRVMFFDDRLEACNASKM